MARSRLLTFEVLEQRALPAVFGTPWPFPQYLTLSFAPDGTQIAGHSSDLFAVLGESSASDWQRELLRAVQTWAVNANINVGVVADGGQPFGIPGMTQGDPRFGDIRIGAQKMSPTALAITVPHDPYLSGTWAGDVLLNSSYTFTEPQADLFGVMLHEFGHALGLAENGSPDSRLSSLQTGGPQQGLSAQDIAAVQALYGIRAPDANEGSRGNDTFRTATRIKYPTDRARFDGATPLVAYGDITTNQDVDVFAVQPLPGYQGPITFRLQTAGISLLQPRLSIYDASGRLLGQAQSTNVLGDVVTVQVDHQAPTRLYYARVEGAVADVFGIGRYALAVSFDARLTTPAEQIDAVLRGPFDKLSADDIDEIFRDREEARIHPDHRDHSKFAKALELTTSRGFALHHHYDVIDSLEPGHVAYYRVRAPQDGPSGSVVLTAAVNALSINGGVPRVEVFDAARQPIPAEVLVNGNGALTVQAVGLKRGESYFLKLSVPEGGTARKGNFSLVVDFQQPAEMVQTFASGTLTAAVPEQPYKLYVAQNQLFFFSLSASAPGGTADAPLRMTITDSTGAVVYELTARPGETVSSTSLLLRPGEYTVRFAVSAPSAAVTYKLRATAVTDPIGPVIEDPTLAPMYTRPGDPFTYLYPGGQVSLNPFLWLALAL